MCFETCFKIFNRIYAAFINGFAVDGQCPFCRINGLLRYQTIIPDKHSVGGSNRVIQKMRRSFDIPRPVAQYGHSGILAFHWVSSEARRVGKESVSTCRSRWWPYHLKKKK